jgi:hypothetical protein
MEVVGMAVTLVVAVMAAVVALASFWERVRWRLQVTNWGLSTH